MKPIKPQLAWMAATALLLGITSATYAEHFQIRLTVSSAGEKDTSVSDTSTATHQQGFKPRPVVHAKASEELVLQFFLTSSFPHDAIRDVTIRYFVVAEEKAGQEAVPSTKNAVTTGSFTMDFKPETGKVGLRQRLKIETPGTYLVRVQSENSANDHEHFSAIDLIVE